MDENKKTVMIVDSNALIHRAYHALPGLVDPKGVLVNAVYGFCLIFLKAISEIKPDYIVATFDVKGKTFRHEEFAEYKAQRKKNPDNFYEQIPMVKDFLKSLNILVLEKEGFEADDVIGTVCEKFKDEDLNIIVVTGDLDTLQLLTDKVNVWTLKKGITNSTVYDIRSFEEKYSLKVNQFVDFKALKGDPSDNIPGVKGIGEKTAMEILTKYISLDNIFENIDKFLSDPMLKEKDKKWLKVLKENEDEARFSQHLSKIKKDVDIEVSLEMAKFSFDSKEETIKFFKEKGFNSLVSKLNMGFQNVNIVHNETHNDERKLKELDIEEFFEEFGSEELFVFDNIAMNIPGEGVAAFFENDDVFYVVKTEAEKLQGYLQGKTLVTFDSKILYHKYFDVFKDYVFYDLKLAFWLLDPDRKDYTIETLVKKFNIKTDKAISFIPNYELDDWLVLFTNIYELVVQKITALKLERVLKEIEMPLTPVLVQMEREGILLDTKVLKKIRDKIHLEILTLEEEIFELTGEKFNINSPKQLSEVLFEKLKLPSKGLAKTTTKNISTNSDELEKILDMHESIPKILRFKELKKLENSFLDPLPTFMKSDGRIHTTFVQTGTATGRLSSDTPNLQNIPVKGDYGQLVRKAFIASPGYDLVSCDYSQMELRIAAKLANDKLMMEAFKTGKDFHRFTASLVNHIDYDKVTNEQRNKAKALNFGIIYGMGMRSFSQSANISKEEARAFVEEYFENYFGLRNFLDTLKARAKDKGYCETLYGRKRFLSFIGAYGFQAALEERISINMPVQGLAADIIKVAMIKIAKYLKDNKLEKDIKMLLQIHDELIFEVKEGIADEEVFKQIDRIMEENEFDILLKADQTRAENWGDLKN